MVRQITCLVRPPADRNSATGAPPDRFGAARRVRQLRQVDHRDPQQPPGRGHRADIAAGRRRDRARRSRRAWRACRRSSAERLAVRRCGPADPVEDSSTRHGSSATSSGTAATGGARRLQQHRAPRRCRTSWPPRPVRRRPACAARRPTPGSRSARRSRALSRSRSVSSSIRSNLVSRRSGVSRMYCVWMSLSEKRSMSRSLACAELSLDADEADDLVDVEQRDQQALDQVQPVAPLGAAELAAPAHHLEAVVEVDLQQLLEAQRERLAVHQRHVVDAEGLLHRRQLVELLQHGLRVRSRS